MANINGRLMNVGTWIEGGLTSFNVTSLAEGGQLGQAWESNGCMYQIVKNSSTSGNAALAAGTPVLWEDFDDFLVTVDQNGSGISRNFPAGVSMGTVATGSYGIIQISGPYATVKTNGDDDIALGDTVIYAATDGVVDSVAAGTASTYVRLGIATAADVDADNTVAIQIQVPLNL